MSRKQKFFPSTCLVLAGIAGLNILQPAMAAESAQTLPIKKISADASQELVIEFAAKAFPTAPQVLDLPGPNHRVVIDFTDASVDKGAVQSAEELSKVLTSSIPFIKAVRYSELENAPKPTARLVIDLPENVKVKPRVVKLEEGMVVIGFSDQPIQTSQAPAEPPVAETASTTESELRPSMPEETKAEEPAQAGAEKTPAATSGGDDKKAAADANPKLESVKLYNKAVQLHLAGKLSEAIIAYKEALESNKALAEAHSNLGLIYNQQHNYAQALSEFRKALAINPKDAITYNGIGAALRAEHDLAGAIKNWQTAVSLDAKLATAHYNLGTAYEIQKDYDKSMTSYRAAVKNDYRLGEAYYRMGLIMERKNRSEEAAEQFKEALKVSGDSEYSEDARQRLVYLQGKKGKTQ